MVDSAGSSGSAGNDGNAGGRRQGHGAVLDASERCDVGGEGIGVFLEVNDDETLRCVLRPGCNNCVGVWKNICATASC